ncbi:PanM family protein (plasmid) [Polaromonas sp. P1-6]|nr:PanM family protein [Polaromonas sp. P1-6]
MENEINRKVICFDSLVAAMTESQKQICYRLSDKGLFMCLVETEGKGWSVVGDIKPMWVTISDLCARAVTAEKGELLVDGKRIKAEDYITSWRSMSTARISVEVAVKEGFTPLSDDSQSDRESQSVVARCADFA